MPHVVESCSACFCCDHVGHVGDGVLLVANGFVSPWQPKSACLLQGRTALHWAAQEGHVAVVETLLLNSADLEARSKSVRCNSLYKTLESLQYTPIVPMSECLMPQGHW